MVRKLLLLLLLFSFNSLFSQYKQLGPNAEISVLTMGPGNSLNDSFGHSAFRVKDGAFDIIFNYGVYDFDAPNFYLKFAQGKLNYVVETAPYEAFKNWYASQDRSIKEQFLDLSYNEKQQVFNYLATNAEPENKYYLYDFFFDNCATKIRDVLENSIDAKVEFNPPSNFKAESFRDLIQQNLHRNSWGSFGIDVALGSIIDRDATSYEYMFLPEYIATRFNNATLHNKPLVKDTVITYEGIKTPEKGSFVLSPFFLFSIISLWMLYITFSDYKKQKRSKWLDIIIFAVTGIIGVFLLLLWFATDHQATGYNYNLLWAFAINLFVIGQVFKTIPKKWFMRYIKFLIIMIVLMSFHWIIGLQHFPLVFIPILIALLVRYLFLVRFYKVSTDL